MPLNWFLSQDDGRRQVMKDIQSAMGLLYVLICSFVCLLIVTTEHLDLSEGDICKEVNGTLWVCKSVKNCPKANIAHKEWEVIQYQLCKPQGEEVIVCCEPEFTSMAKLYAGEKSKEMCKKYAEAVFVKMPNVSSENTFTKIDTCYIHPNYEDAIHLGFDVDHEEFPHMALIGFGNASSIDWWCGGSLISETYVLSAAHCSVSGKGEARWVRLGDYNFQSKEDEKKGYSKSVEYEITEIINHPNYTSSSFYNDITLYKLNATVEFNKFIRPLCLHTEYDIPDILYTATGWGIVQWGGKQSAILQKALLLINTSKECKEAYKGTNGNKLKDGIKDESMLCAGDLFTGADTCQGDSGGPLQLYHPQEYCMYLQIGITSFGSLCGGNYHGVYTRVSHFIPWIESVVWP